MNTKNSLKVTDRITFRLFVFNDGHSNILHCQIFTDDSLSWVEKVMAREFLAHLFERLSST